MIYVDICFDKLVSILLQFPNCENVSQVEDLARQYLVDEGLLSEQEDSPYPVIYFAASINTSEHEDLTEQDAKDSLTFVDWLVGQEAAVLVTNLIQVGPEE